MADFVTITPEGRFALGGQRWLCNSVVYYGRYPGSCGPDWWRDGRWDRNAAELDRDFAAMAQVGLNHAAMFFHNDMFFDAGRIKPGSMQRMDTIVAAAKKAGLRISIFLGPFIDTPEVYHQITGQRWTYDNRFLPSFNEHLHEAYVKQMLPFAERYRAEPAVLAYTDRIDRFHKGFDNVTIPFNLKDHWHQWLQARYGTIAGLLEAVGGPGALENEVRDFGDVLLPQESRSNASLRNPLAYDYINWQKQSIGAAQARFDAAISAVAPRQFVWTPFEGNTNTWAMLDGFSPRTKLLQAIWMEYYFFEMTRPSFVQPFEEWAHTPEIHHSRLSHQLPVVYNAAYAMCRYLKLSTQRPVVICHGAWTDAPAYGTQTHEQQAAVIDRVNAACLAADGDGWHYWNWRDDEASWYGKARQRFENPTQYWFAGESLGLNDFEGFPKPALSLVARYSREARRREAAPLRRSDVLLLSSAPRMYSLFRRLALPTAAAVNGALTRCGALADYLWTAQDDQRISPDTLARYRLIVSADNVWECDFRDTPAKLLDYVRAGGTLLLALDNPATFKDEHGVVHDNPAHRLLVGVDDSPAALRQWPGANQPARNWPYPTDPVQEANFDVQGFPRVQWGVCPAFRAFVPYPEKLQLLGFRSLDGDRFTPVTGLVPDAEVIAVAKFPAGTVPFVYRHPIGTGMVYVNAWTQNIYRDNEQRHDHGAWDYDWIVDLALATSGARCVDLTAGASIWLRNTWGYFWPTI